MKTNYNECLTNLACSIRKYFELDYKHNTLEYIDKILEDTKPKNVVTILFDGLGANILDNILGNDSFLTKNKLKNISSVFPATTVAATTSIRTGLNPVESGMLGWNMYYKDINKIITVFKNTEKSDATKTILPEAKEYKDKHMKTKTINEEINEIGKYKSYCLFPFGDDCYTDLDDMIDRIVTLCNTSPKKYIYAYDDEPDHLMHDLGPYSKEVKDLVRYRNIMIQKLSEKLKDTIIFVVADHGHLLVDNIFLQDYPDIIECMERNTSLEPRATCFFIKEDKKKIFPELFNKYFGEWFTLYTKEEVINNKLFGPGEENTIFRDAIGDFISVSKSNKALIGVGDSVLISQHSGFLDDEVLVPLVVISV